MSEIGKEIPVEEGELARRAAQEIKERSEKFSEVRRLSVLQRTRTYDKIAPQWWHNVRKNLEGPGIRSDYQVTDVVRELSPQAKHSRTVWVFASGASLKQFEDDIAEIVGNDLCIVSPTTAPWFVHHAKRMPDIVFSIDVSDQMLSYCMAGGLRGRPIYSTEAEGGESIKGYDGPPLMAPTTANNELVRFFFPKVYWFNSLLQDLKPETAGRYDTDSHSQHMMWLNDHIRFGIPQLGCVTNEAVVLVNLLSHRQCIEATRVCLAGADYGYWNDLSRVPTGVRDADGTLTLNKYKSFRDDADNQDVVDWRGMKSNSRMIQYTIGLVAGWQQTKMPIYRLSAGPGESVLDGFFPNISGEQVKSEDWPEYPSSEEIDRICTDYIEKEYPENYPRAVAL